MVRRLRYLVGSLLVLGACMSGCADFSERYYGRTDEYLPAREVPYSEARREAILLLLELQQTLTDEFDVGEWTPPSLGGRRQVGRSDSGCPAGTVRETWSLATAGPLTEETWPQAVDRFTEILTPLGFGKPIDIAVAKDTPNVLFVNEETGVQVDFGYNKATAVRVTTGCVRGKWSQDWPAGTEVIPEELRTTGRAIHSGEPEEWAPYVVPTEDTE
ncbi:hypothetical protein EKN07_11215 [Actinobaculum sp. 352]|nr:hypothetical protein DDD63_00695 [Actinobaculum sp. 313]RTE48034.1 hypothetical protein EKN07_11215 [Actinobaculum sp. 352]